jgi:hypothetical protein
MKRILLALCLTAGTLFAQETPPQAQVTQLMEKALTDSPGKEVHPGPLKLGPTSGV